MYRKLAKGMKKSVTTEKPKKNGKTVKGGKVKRSNPISRTCSDNSTFSPESAMNISGVSPKVLSNEEACGISKSISDFIRREVANAMMTGILNPKAIQAAESTWRGGNEFVKLDDVKDIVYKIIPNLDGSIIKSDTKQVEETIKRIKNRLFIVEESVKKIESRITAIEQSLGPVRAQNTVNVPFLDPLVPSSSMTRLPDISKIRLPPQSYDVNISESSEEDSDYLDKKFGSEGPILSRPGKDGKKICDYELIDKYNRQEGGREQTLKKAIFPSQSLALDDKTELQHRMAERRLFETNMLLYQKSPFTLHLNSHKDHVSNALGFPSSKVTPNHEFRSRIRRTEFTRNTEESQWLFEQ